MRQIIKVMAASQEIFKPHEPFGSLVTSVTCLFSQGLCVDKTGIDDRSKQFILICVLLERLMLLNCYWYHNDDFSNHHDDNLCDDHCQHRDLDGHADNAGIDSHESQLSMYRNQGVVDYLNLSLIKRVFQPKNTTIPAVCLTALIKIRKWPVVSRDFIVTQRTVICGCMPSTKTPVPSI